MSESQKIPESISVELIRDQRTVLPLLGMGRGWLVVDKPENALTENHSWYPNEWSLVRGLNFVLNHPEQSKRFGVCIAGISKRDVRSVFELDREISGVAMFVLEEKLIQNLRNAYGSQQLEFVFQFFTRGSVNDHADRVCDLPMAPHFSEPRMLVSHQSGKKTHTHFRFLKNWGPISLWEARVNFIRCHQIRVHAAEVGLPILGESLYANEAPVYLSELKRLRKYPEVEEPICPGVCLHLAQVSWDAKLVEADMPNVWNAPLRPKMNVLIKKLNEKYE